MERKVINTTIPLTSTFTHILFNLAAQGYSHIRIQYSGGGDDGAIDDVTLIERGGIEEIEGEIHELDNIETADVDKELEDVIKEKAHEYVLDSASDWYNNDGGGGTLYISCDDGKYICDHYIYELRANHETLEGQFGD